MIRSFLLVMLLILFGYKCVAQVGPFHKVLTKSDIRSLEYDEEQALIIIKDKDYNLVAFDGLDTTTISEPHIRAREYSKLNIDGNVVKLSTKYIEIPALVNDAIRVKDGTVYIATENGLYVIEDDYPKRFYHPLVSQIKAVNHLYYADSYLFFVLDNNKLVYWNGKNNDLLSFDNTNIEFNTFSDIMLDPYGMLWLSDNNGLYSSHFIPLNHEEVAKIFLKDIEINGESIGANYKINVEPGDNLKCKITAHHTALPSKIKYYFELKRKGRIEYGYDENIQNSKVIKTQPLFFTDIENEGDYFINVKASVDSKYFSYLAPIEIIVRKKGIPLFIKIGIVGFIAMLLLWLFSSYRYRRFTNKLLHQRDRLILENKLLKHQQKALQLQMNPHFIFNVLNSIQGLIAKGEARDSRKHLNAFSQLMRSMLDQSREEFITIENEIKYIKHYLDLEQMCRNNTFDYVVDVDASLDLSLVTLPMIIQPFVENAIIHAFKGITYKGSLEVMLKEKNDHLEVTVLDNGVGIKNKRDDGHKSHATAIVGDRLETAFGKKGTYFWIETNKNDSAKGIGTKITIKLPLR